MRRFVPAGALALAAGLAAGCSGREFAEEGRVRRGEGSVSEDAMHAAFPLATEKGGDGRHEAHARGVR